MASTPGSERPYSFSEFAKEEAAMKRRGAEPSLSLLSAYARLRGHLEEKTIVLVSEHAQIARSLYERLKEGFGIRGRFSYTRGKGYLSRISYRLLIDDPGGEILRRLGVGESEIDSSLLEGEERESAYLAGAFMASGSVNAPSSSNYHLEIVAPEKEAPALLHVLQRAKPRFPFRLLHRGKRAVLYLKRSSSISDFLIYIGASESCLRFENARVDRDFAAISNRFSNLDGANYRRSAKAGEGQLAAIARAKENPNYLASNPKLAALVELRLAHPDASLSELASLLGERLGCTVSKSNVNHLFRKIIADYGGKR